MNEGEVGALLREAMLVSLQLAGPPLLAALCIGLLMALVQAVTQINETTLVFVPKAVGIGLALLLLGPYMHRALDDFARTLFDRAVAVGGL